MTEWPREPRRRGAPAILCVDRQAAARGDGGAYRASDPEARLCLERAELVTESYQRTEGEPWVLRRAKALAHLLRHGTARLGDDELLAGSFAEVEGGLSLYPELSAGWICWAAETDLAGHVDEGDRRRLGALSAYWREASVEGSIRRDLGLRGLEANGWAAPSAYGPWLWPLGTATPDLEKLFRLGLRGLVAEARWHRAKLSRSAPGYGAKVAFYDAAEVSALAVIDLSERYAALAREEATLAPPGRRERLEELAAVCEWVPAHGPKTFHEALQSLALCHLVSCRLDGGGSGLGHRIDQVLWPYYDRDMAVGRLTRPRAVELLAHLFAKLDGLGYVSPVPASSPADLDRWARTLVVGGLDENGRDAANELSLVVLEASARAERASPRIVVHHHEGAAPALLEAATMAVGAGAPPVAIVIDRVAAPLRLDLAARHLYPEAAARLGLGTISRLRRAGRRRGPASRALGLVLSGPTGEAVHGAVRDLAVEVGRREGLVWGAFRSGLSVTGILDAPRALTAARGWTSGTSSLPALPGIALQGSATSVAFAGVVDLAALAAGQAPRTPLPRGSRQDLEASAERLAAALGAETCRCAELFALFEPIFRERLPRPFASMLTTDALARGQDASERGDGALSEILVLGVEDAAAALAAACGLSDADAALDLLLPRALAAVRSVRDHFGMVFEWADVLEPCEPGKETDHGRSSPRRRSGAGLRRSRERLDPARSDQGAAGLAGSIRDAAARGRWAVELEAGDRAPGGERSAPPAA